MSTDHNLSKAASPTVANAPSPAGKRRADQIDEPARPLGPKSAALQMRRRRNGASTVPAGVHTTTSEALWLLSKDGSIGIVLRESIRGLLLERTQRQEIGTRLVQCMVLADATAFDRWCESEPMRFEDPVLYDRIRREGHEALGGKR